nr:transposase [Nonomuraea phyllanthi]
MLLHKIADRVGLTEAFGALWPTGQSTTWRDRAHVLVALATAIACGARSLLEAERLQAHQAALFGTAPSDSTTHRTLADLDKPMLARIAKTRARVRRHVWQLLHLRPGGFPWLTVAGKRLRGWIVIDIDATIITSASDKHGAVVTFKKTYGFHPLACWCANTQEALAMLLRSGNAGSNTVADHLRVLTDAPAQIPNSCQAKILVRVDGAGATHDLLTHLEGLNTTRRTVRYLVGWTITGLDEQAIAHLPARLAAHARHRHLRIERTWPSARAFVLAWQRLTDLPALTWEPDPTTTIQEGTSSGPVEPGAPAASRDGPPPPHRGHYGQTAEPLTQHSPLKNRG